MTPDPRYAYDQFCPIECALARWHNHEDGSPVHPELQRLPVAVTHDDQSEIDKEFQDECID